MSPQMWDRLMTILGVLVGGGGAAGAVYSLMKLRPEASEKSVLAAEKVIELQTKAVERVEAENKALREELKQYEEVNKNLRLEMESMRARIRELEAKVG